MYKNNKPIRSFKDLDVYQNTYQSRLNVMKNALPRLPDSEKYYRWDQLSRLVKAIPRFIGEGYAKRLQKYGFQKYLDDAMAEANETIVGLEMCRDLYGKRMIDIDLAALIDT